MSTQDDINWVLQLAEDKLEHLRSDADGDEHTLDDYLYSKEALERVRDFFASLPDECW